MHLRACLLMRARVLCRRTPPHPPHSTPPHTQHTLTPHAMHAASAAQTHILYDLLDVTVHPLGLHLTEAIAVKLWVSLLPPSPCWAGGKRDFLVCFIHSSCCLLLFIAVQIWAGARARGFHTHYHITTATHPLTIIPAHPTTYLPLYQRHYHRHCRSTSSLRRRTPPSGRSSLRSLWRCRPPPRCARTAAPPPRCPPSGTTPRLPARPRRCECAVLPLDITAVRC